jgi:hypothetical protein
MTLSRNFSFFTRIFTQFVGARARRRERLRRLTDALAPPPLRRPAPAEGGSPGHPRPREAPVTARRARWRVTARPLLLVCFCVHA